MSLSKWEVQQNLIHDNWQNTFETENGLMTFETKEEAEAELKEFLHDCNEAVNDGFLTDCPDRSDFRICLAVSL